MKTENFEQLTLHEKDIEAAEMLEKFGLKFADINDKHRHLKVYNTQLTNNGFNYTGGKYELASIIRQLMPSNIHTFYDVCGGAGTMGINITANLIIHNEYDEYLSNLVKSFSKAKAEDNYIKVFNTVKKYELTDVITKKKMIITTLNKFKWSNEPKSLTLSDHQNHHKIFCMKCLDRFNQRFLTLREDFNNNANKPWEMFYTLLVFSFDNTIKYKKDTKIFNNTFNERNFNNSLKAKLLLFSKKLIENKDGYSFENESYADLLKDLEDVALNENDFFYFDPPYFITDNNYTREYWHEKEEIDFLQHLVALNKKVVNGKRVKFGLSNVIHHSGKTNNFLIDFINKNKLYVHYLPKSYESAGKTEKKHPTVEVYVTNYPTVVCPKHIKVPMKYDKSAINTELIETLKYDDVFIQGRLVIDDKNSDNEVENIIKHSALSHQATQKADNLEGEASKERLKDIKHKIQMGISAEVLKAKYKGDKGAYTKAIEKTPISITTAQRYMKFIKDNRIMALKDEELLKIPMLTYTKLVKMMELDDDNFYKVVKGNLAILPKIAKEKEAQKQANKNKANEVAKTVESKTTASAQKVIDNSEAVETKVISKVDGFVKPAYSTLSDERNKEIESLDIDEAKKQLTMLESAGWLILNNTSHAQNNIFPFNRVS